MSAEDSTGTVMTALGLSKTFNTINHPVVGGIQKQEVEYPMSPDLFNLYSSGIPRPSDGIEIMTYADDCTPKTSGPIIDDIYH